MADGYGSKFRALCVTADSSHACLSQDQDQQGPVTKHTSVLHTHSSVILAAASKGSRLKSMDYRLQESSSAPAKGNAMSSRLVQVPPGETCASMHISERPGEEREPREQNPGNVRWIDNTHAGGLHVYTQSAIPSDDFYLHQLSLFKREPSVNFPNEYIKFISLQLSISRQLILGDPASHNIICQNEHQRPHRQPGGRHRHAE